MANLLMPYGSRRYSHLMKKETEVGKRGQKLRSGVLTVRDLGLRLVRHKAGRG